jgi:hypothetical protein
MPKVLQRQHRRCPSCSKVRISTAYFAWGRVIIFFISIFISAIFAIICYVLSVRHCRADFACLYSWYHCKFYITLHILYWSTVLSIAYFAWGRAIIYLKIWCRSLSQLKRKIYIFLFILFWKKESDDVRISHAFIGSVFDWNVSRWIFLCATWSYLTKETVERKIFPGERIL